MIKYKRLTLVERSEIFAFKTDNLTITQIAGKLDRNKSTISRELRRNGMCNGHYKPDNAQFFATYKSTHKKHYEVLDSAMEGLIDDKLVHAQWSPEQISGRCHKDKVPMASMETIYQYIYRHKKDRPELAANLRCQHRQRHNRLYQDHKSSRIPNRVSIHERPAYIEDKKSTGHWEIDLVESANHKMVALTAVERHTKFALVIPRPNKKKNTITQAVIKALSPFKDKVKSITSDNGNEFCGHDKIQKALNCKYYFADPYASWQRGLNENTNKLIRQYLPKKSDFHDYSNAYFKKIQNNLNARPRKCLKFKTPNELFFHTFDQHTAVAIATGICRPWLYYILCHFQV